MENNNEDVYKFFIDKLNIDFRKLPPLKARMLIDEMNKKLDECIKVEQEKNNRLKQEILAEKNRIAEFTNEA